MITNHQWVEAVNALYTSEPGHTWTSAAREVDMILAALGLDVEPIYQNEAM